MKVVTIKKVPAQFLSKRLSDRSLSASRYTHEENEIYCHVIPLIFRLDIRQRVLGWLVHQDGKENHSNDPDDR